MSMLNKSMGLTFPFKQGTEIGYAKPQVNFTLDLDKPFGPQLEQAALAHNVIDDFLVEVLERMSVRYLGEYASDTSGNDILPRYSENDEKKDSSHKAGEEIPWQFDPRGIRNMVQDVLRRNGITDDPLLLEENN